MGTSPEDARDDTGTSGIGTGEGDAADLRARLRQAEERLASYQAFDRDIAENVRRSSELMLEAMQVRERMERDATRLAGEQRARLVGHVGALEREFNGIRDQVTAALERLAAVREEVGTVSNTDVDAIIQEETESPAAESSTSDGGEPMVDDAPAEGGAAAVIDDEQAGPRAVNVIAHGVPRAAVALALQAHLRALPQVKGVDAREFSSGVLRLHIMVEGALEDADLLGWAGDEQVTVARQQEDAIELHIDRQAEV